ncbi:MAG: hypothetical protein K2I87_02855 [Bacteroidales bacterium]|nr:hypothetical protein [Bacteroidales bacterium]
MGKNRIKPKPIVQDPLPEPELVMEFEGRKPEKEEKEEQQPDEAELQRREQRRLRRKKIRSALDGSVLLDKGLQRYGWLVLYAFFWAMLLISNNYLSESVVRESSIIKGELKELQFRQISSQAELMRLSRQSSVAGKLQGTGVKESVVPPYKIKQAEEPAEQPKK